jgi:hypothetical protein
MHSSTWIRAASTLLPKKVETVSLNDYHPISLIHILDKLFSKVLVNRLATMLDSLVHCSQNAFIKGCYATSRVTEILIKLLKL